MMFPLLLFQRPFERDAGRFKRSPERGLATALLGGSSLVRTKQPQRVVRTFHSRALF